MRPAPTPLAIVRYPVTGGLALLAIGVSVASFYQVDVSALYADPRIAHGEPWRLVTSILPHVDPLHVLFNAFWLWALGTVVEDAFGLLRTAGLYLFLGLGSSAADYATFEGGIGLSGVVYGVFGMLLVLTWGRRNDPRFARAIDLITGYVFIAWFFLCIAGAAIGAMRVANVAHAVGLVLGVLAGLAVAAGGATRAAYWGACAVIVGVAIVGATVARPWVNFSSDRGAYEAALGYQASGKGRHEEAARWYRRALRMQDRNADWWYGLAWSLWHAGRQKEALEGFRRAADLAPEKEDYRLEYERQKAYYAPDPPAGGQDGQYRLGP